jgi:hypothetical protein
MRQLPEFSEDAAETADQSRPVPASKYGKRAEGRKAEAEPTITLPATVNGQITPGDVDRYRFSARKGQQLVVAASARTLIPYLADAVPGWFQATLALYDAQQAGGSEYAYRLRISPPRPDFALRIVPSSVSVRNSATVPITVYALRMDGFSDEITLELKDAPEGFRLTGGKVPAGEEKADVTLTVAPTQEPVTLHLEGRATINGRTVSHRAVPAEDLTQAFAYQHLVPTQDFKVAVSGRVPSRRPSNTGSKFASKAVLKVVDKLPVRIPAGGTVSVKLGASRPMYLGNVKLQLNNPPDGIDIQEATPSRGSLQVVLQSDAAKVEPGQRGKLLLRATAKKTNASKSNPAAKRRLAALASLPAIPFVIVEP